MNNSLSLQFSNGSMGQIPRKKRYYVFGTTRMFNNTALCYLIPPDKDTDYSFNHIAQM